LLAQLLMQALAASVAAQLARDLERRRAALIATACTGSRFRSSPRA
jgi:hypothetical protein